jgi:protein-tyrosine sulfotransferase
MRIRVSRLARRVTDAAVLMVRILFCRIPLSSSLDRLSCNPFFIVGSGRSGNTLLRAMLVQHPRISIPPESYVLPKVTRKFLRYNFLPWGDLARMVISEFECHPHFYSWELEMGEVYRRAIVLKKDEQSLARLLDVIYSCYGEKKSPGAVRWGDKTPLNTLNLEKLSWVFPQAQYIHMIRDGRDVVSSYLETRMYPSVEEAAKRWLRSVDRARVFGKRVGTTRYREVRYENLVRRPAECLEEICSYLGVDYVATMLDYWKTTDQLGDAMFSYHANIQNPVSVDSLGRWRERLSVQDQARLLRLISHKLEELGYSTG